MSDRLGATILAGCALLLILGALADIATGAEVGQTYDCQTFTISKPAEDTLIACVPGQSECVPYFSTKEEPKIYCEEIEEDNMTRCLVEAGEADDFFAFFVEFGEGQQYGGSGTCPAVE